jgi:hypothetical protein
MRKRNLRNKERGMALLIALMALFLISAVGLGMMYMSTGETSINANYKDTQLAFFAMRGGLEEARDRLRSNSPSPLTTLPTTKLPGAAGSIVYITNPSPSDPAPVKPDVLGNLYFDDELCHETVAGMAYVAPGTGPCTSQPPAGSVQAYVPSVSPYTNTSSSLSYKWVRITLKANNTFPNALVNSTPGDTSQVCWDSARSQEVTASSLGYADCPTAKQAGLQVGPLYIITSLAITPQGSRRIGQYETAAESMTPPPGALSLDGPAAAPPAAGIFQPVPNSNPYHINGTDGSAPSGAPPPVPGCTPNQAAAPAIGTSSSGVASIMNPATGIPSNRYGNYDSGGNTLSTNPTAVVADDSSSLTGMYANTGTLNNLVSMLADGADATLNGCSMNGVGGSACVPPASGLGTTANPQITFVNGDLNWSGATSGAGVLIVTGNLNIVGTPTFAGLVLVIGQGTMMVQGGGNGTFYGSVFVANTNSHTSPFSQLATLGQPELHWNGGGGNGIYYNSCWADRINNMHFMVVASREEMY